MNHFDGSECRTGHEPAAHDRRKGGFHAAEAGEDVGGGRRWGRIRVWGRQTRGESPRRPAEDGRAPGIPEVRPLRVFHSLFTPFFHLHFHVLTDRGAATVTIKSSFQDKKTFNSVFFSICLAAVYLWRELLTCTGGLKSSTDTRRVRKLTCKLSATQIIQIKLYLLLL